MIINLRGTHGAGKTKVITTVLANGSCRLYGVALGPWMPEAYRLKIPHVEKPVFVIGPYDTGGCDGCDRIQPFDLIPPLIEKYAERGHVVFEGALISTCWGAVGEVLAQRAGSVVLFLDTQVETCVERVRARRLERGDDREFDPTQLAAKHARIASLRTKVEARGVRALTVSSENAVEIIIEVLRHGR